jgi:hypothetical protein
MPTTFLVRIQKVMPGQYQHGGIEGVFFKFKVISFGDNGFCLCKTAIDITFLIDFTGKGILRFIGMGNHFTVFTYH